MSLLNILWVQKLPMPYFGKLEKKIENNKMEENHKTERVQTIKINFCMQLIKMLSIFT